MILKYYSRYYRVPHANCEFNGKIHVIVPAKSEPLDVLAESMYNNRALLKLGKVTYVLDEYGIDDLSKITTLARGLGYHVIWRERSKGLKANALNHALRELGLENAVLVLDVDSYMTLNDVLKSLALLCKYDAVTPSWEAKNCDDTRLSKGLCLGYKAFFNDVLKGLYVLTGWVPVLGSGSIVRSDVLKKLGLWPESMLEDVELGLLMFLNGFKPAYNQDVRTYVEVPPTYHAFIKQQIRWCYGTANLLRRYFWRLIKSRKGIVITLYLSQYMTYVAHMISFLTLITSTLLNIQFSLITLLIAIITALTSMSYIYIMIGRPCLREIFAFSTMGIVYLLSMPRIAFSFILGLLDVKKVKWIPTPKGSARHFRYGEYHVEYFMTLITVITFIYSILNGLLINALILLPYTTGLIRGVWRLLKGTL